MDSSAAKSHDRVLIERILVGDQEAMTVLYDRYSPLVYSVALQRSGNPRIAEEILQEVFLELWRIPGNCRPIPRMGLALWLKNRVQLVELLK